MKLKDCWNKIQGQGFKHRNGASVLNEQDLQEIIDAGGDENVDKAIKAVDGLLKENEEIRQGILESHPNFENTDSLTNKYPFLPDLSIIPADDAAWLPGLPISFTGKFAAVEIDGFVYETQQDGFAIGETRKSVEEMLSRDNEFFRNKPKAKAFSKKINQRDKKKIDRIAGDLNDDRMDQLDEIPTNARRRRETGGAMVMAGRAPNKMPYWTMPVGESQKIALNLLAQQKDLFEAAEDVKKDPTLRSLDIIEDTLDTNEYGGIAGAYLMEVQMRIKQVLTDIHDDDTVTLKTKNYVSQLSDDLEKAIRQDGKGSGAKIKTMGFIGTLWDAVTTKTALKDTLLTAVDRIIGKKGKEKLESLTQQLNQALAENSDRASISPKVIALLNKIHKVVGESKFKIISRQTIAKSLDAIRKVTSKASARMATHQAYSEDSEERANKAIESLVKAMSGIQKTISGPTETELFYRTLEKFVRRFGRDMKVIMPTISTKKNSIDQVVVILKNPSLYSMFASSLHRAYVEEYGATEGKLKQSADELQSFLQERRWEEGLIEDIINQKFKENNVRLAELVSQSYQDSGDVKEKIKAQVSKYLKDQGINDDSLTNALVEDIDKDMEERLDRARKKFFGSAKTLKEFLRHQGLTLSEMVKSLAESPQKMYSKFEDALEKEYDIPNTTEYPYASQLATLMVNELYNLTAKENQRILDNWIKKVGEDVKPQNQKKFRSAIEKTRQAISLGIFESEDFYSTLADEFNLPPWDEKLSTEIQKLGKLWFESNTDRQRQKIDQEITNLLTAAKGFSTWSSYESWMYMSMLSAFGTHARNFLGNSMSLVGFFQVETIKAIREGEPGRVISMFQAMLKAAGGKGQLEAREAWVTGYNLGKDDQKWIPRSTALESVDPHFVSKVDDWPRLAAIDKGAAELVHRLGRGIKGQYVGRALIAMDVMFRKVGEEMAFVRRVGSQAALVTPEMWDSAVMQAKQDFVLTGRDPNSPENEREVKVLAHSIAEDLRLRDKDGIIIPERAQAWTESRSEGLDVTFNQEPRGIAGAFHQGAKRLTTLVPAMKAFIPFTQVAANITNQLLDWTPYGLVRFGLGHYYGDDFRTLDSNGQPVGRNQDIAIRSILGIGWTIALMAMAASYADDEEPYFAIYGNGPRDIDGRRILREKGWRPNSIKVGGMYASYLQSPLAMALSIAGKQFDDYRDGKIESVGSIRLATMTVALMEAVKEQSFIATAADLASAVDGPEPEKNVSKVISRTATLFLPNILKSFDKFIDPSVQEAEGFLENFVKEVPVVRHVLKDSLNIFGQPIERSKGFIPIPSFENILGMEKTNDPVLNLVSDKGLRIPGYSASTRINNKPIGDKRYEYVQIAGPRIYERIKVNLPEFKTMSREDLNREIEKIAREEKENARRELETKYPDLFVNE